MVGIIFIIALGVAAVMVASALVCWKKNTCAHSLGPDMCLHCRCRSPIRSWVGAVAIVVVGYALGIAVVVVVGVVCVAILLVVVLVARHLRKS